MSLRLTLAHLGLIIFPDAIHQQVQHIGLLLMHNARSKRSALRTYGQHIWWYDLLGLMNRPAVGTDLHPLDRSLKLTLPHLHRIRRVTWHMLCLQEKDHKSQVAQVVY